MGIGDKDSSLELSTSRGPDIHKVGALEAPSNKPLFVAHLLISVNGAKDQGIIMDFWTCHKF